MKILGTTDTVNECACCGRLNLKKTVAIENHEGISYYGVVCAAHILQRTKKEITQSAAKADLVAKEKRRAEFDQRIEAERAAWALFIFKETGATNLSEGIKILGGFNAARQAFNAAK